MGFGLFKEIVGKLPWLKGVQLSGLGEPLLHPQLWDMVRFVKGRGLKCTITTNGTLLDKRHIEQVFESRLDTLHVSIDSEHGEPVWDKVARLVEERSRRRSKLQVIVNSVLMRRTFRDAEEIVWLADLVGVDQISFSDIQYSYDVGVSKRNQSIRLMGREEKADASKFFNQMEMYRTSFNMPRFAQPSCRQWCEQPWTYIVIDETGKVRPCCGVHFEYFGDLTKQPLDEIWNNEQFQRLRAGLVSETPPLSCKTCAML